MQQQILTKRKANLKCSGNFLKKHPLTRTQLTSIKRFWNEEKGECKIEVVDPQVKILACGEEGTGAMANVSDIVAATRSSLCL